MTLSSTLTDFSINVLIILPVPQDCSAQIRSVLLSIIDCTIYFVLWNGFLVRGRVGGPPPSLLVFRVHLSLAFVIAFSFVFEA